MKISNILVFISNATWGIIQSGIGLLLFLYFINRSHYLYKGCIVTVNAVPRFVKLKGGWSLGIFVFVTHDLKKEDAQTNRLLNHEYGHCLQSLLLGPFYILVIGVPSFLGFCLSPKKRMRSKIFYSYYTFIESWADKWGSVEKKHIKYKH